MSPPARHRAQHPSNPDNESTVRERATTPPPSAPSASAPSASPPTSAGAPRERLEAKLRHARTVLGSLSASDERARLLHVAIMRRDEALLDGVLAALGIARGSVPPGR